MASATWDESSFKYRDISVPESVEIDVVCAKEDLCQVLTMVIDIGGM